MKSGIQIGAGDGQGFEGDAGETWGMSEWSEKPLGTLCSIKTGKKDVNEGYPNGTYPFFTCSRDVHASDSFSFDTDAILIAGNGAVGDTKLYRGKFEAYQRTYVLDGFEEDLDFIFYVLKGSLSESLSKVVSGSTMPYIRKGDLERFPIPLPQLPEQKKIAHILSTVQRTIEAQERSIQTTTELKKALMHKLFTEGLRNEPQKQTEIGPVPESWEVVEFDSFAILQRGKDLMKTQFQGGDIPVAGSNGVIGFHNAATCKGPGVTVGRSGSAGSVIFYESDFWAHNTSLYVRNFHGNHPRYAAYFLEYLDLARFKTDASVPTLDRNSFKHIPVPVPSVPEQIEIAEVPATIDRKSEIAAGKKANIQDLFRTLLYELMTAKLRVASNICEIAT